MKLTPFSHVVNTSFLGQMNSIIYLCDIKQTWVCNLTPIGKWFLWTSVCQLVKQAWKHLCRLSLKITKIEKEEPNRVSGT